MIRRLGSFARMDSLMDQVDHWFFTNVALAGKLDQFIHSHALDFIEDEEGVEMNTQGVAGTYVFSADEEDEFAEDMRRRAHTRKMVHTKFLDLFEKELEAFIRSKRVTLDQFQNVFKISQEEEVREGRIFRWIDVTDYLLFLHTMQTTFKNTKNGDTTFRPSRDLRDQVLQRMEQARFNLRRIKQIRPLLDKWDLDDFTTLVKVLQLSVFPVCRKLKSQDERKFMARWRIKLTQQQRESMERKTSREVMTDYLCRYTEEHDESEFDKAIAYLNNYVDSMKLDERGQRRRLVWALFSAMDENFTNFLLFERVLRFMQRNPASIFHDKEWKKLSTKWTAKLKKSNTEKIEIGINEFQEFIAELLSDLSFDEFKSIVEGFTVLKIDLDK